jgi:hypothetical protein
LIQTGSVWIERRNLGSIEVSMVDGSVQALSQESRKPSRQALVHELPSMSFISLSSMVTLGDAKTAAAEKCIPGRWR